MAEKKKSLKTPVKKATAKKTQAVSKKEVKAKPFQKKIPSPKRGVKSASEEKFSKKERLLTAEGWKRLTAKKGK